MLQTEGTDSQDRDENGEHADADGEEEYGVEEEYEDEEDRLIAQGGIGIPLDEVSQFLTKRKRSSADNVVWTPRSTPTANSARTYWPQVSRARFR